MSPFDPDTFMSQTVDQPFETSMRLPKEGDTQLMIDDFDAKAFKTVPIGKGARAGTEATIFVCPFVVVDEAVKAEAGRDDKLVVPKEYWLDTGPDGGLDWGPNKNIDLGRLRAAVGQNGSGPWSLSMLKGAGPLMGKISHDTYQQNGEDRKKAIITRVAPLR